MISKQEFEQAAEIVRANLTSAMPKMISYKSFIQREVLKVATRQELEDVRDCKINQEMIVRKFVRHVHTHRVTSN